jgi:hypothetical protein
MRTRARIIAATGLLLWSGSGSAQLLPGGLVPPVGQVLGGVGGVSGQTAAVVGNRLDIGPAIAPVGNLLDLRRARIAQLLRDNRAVLDRDEEGAPVRRDAVIALDPSPAALAQAEAQGFRILARETIDGTGIAVTRLAPPKGTDVREAVKLLRQADPAGVYDYDHVYEPAGGALLPMSHALATNGTQGGRAIGLIDGGVGRHPAFAGIAIEQRGFTPGGVRASGHGTAVASLLVGQAGAFRGSAPGVALFAADVYGGSTANGSAEGIARAMGWLAANRVHVVNVSLVGPRNRLIEASVKALQAKGITVVAAIGNDGPAAPVQYPAAYPGVVAVTAVDARDRQLPEAGRAARVDLAAPGADMAAALPGGGYEKVRGTSFAAPLVAGLLARSDLAAVAATAVPGKGRALGRGIVCKPCRVPPKNVGLK